MLPTSSAQPSQPPMNPSPESQPSTRPFPTPHSPPTSDHVVPGLDSGFSDSNFSPPHSSPPRFRRGANYAGPQASLPHHTQPPQMVYSSSPSAFYHPGMPGREASLSHMYAPPSMISMPRPHASYRGASSDPTSSPHQTYDGGTAAPTFPVYPRHTTSPSQSLSQWQASTTSTGEAQHPTSYPTTGAHPPLYYTTQPRFVYPSTSSVPAPPVYGSHYPPPHHIQSHGSPPERENQGVWFYIPPAATTAVRSFEEPGSRPDFNLDYPSPVPQNEGEQSQRTPRYPSLTKRPEFRHRSRTETTPSSLIASSTSSQTGTTETPPSSESRGDWNQERRSYHPKSPAHRSEWVMWVGNVPSDMTSDTLRAFFNRSLPPQPSSRSRQSPDLRQVYGGVISVFLISRSNCAFVNFESEAQLEAAIEHFHDTPIRLRLPRLVCRVRKRTDDLKAGVGAQRGHSMHIKWIKEQREIAKCGGAESVGLAKAIGELSSSSTSDEDQGKSSTPSSGYSGSLTSTNSGILARYFPQRYFILKSLSQDDLDLSVQNNVWTTQEHNEEILDQAYRTSKDVFFIFGVNKSGEFYGYARMAGPILHSEDPVSWASRPASSVPLSRSSSDVEPVSQPARIGIVVGYPDPHYTFPPEENRAVERLLKVNSQTQGEVSRTTSSAPGVFQDPHAQNTDYFKLSADAPYSATPDQGIHQATILARSGESDDILEHARDVAPQTDATKDPKEGLAEVRGRRPFPRPFRVDWIRTKQLSFFRTKHLRNPWNHGREVKISRDGTELEPSVGRQLLEEWDKRSPSPTDIPMVSPPADQRRKSL